MSEYWERITIESPPSEVFRYLSNVGNVSSYVPFVRQARLESGDRLVAVAEPVKQQREISGYFRADTESYRIEWGIDASHYSGFLEAMDAGGGRRTELNVRLSLDRQEDAIVRQTLRQTLAAIKGLVEEQGRGKVMGGGGA